MTGLPGGPPGSAGSSGSSGSPGSAGSAGSSGPWWRAFPALETWIPCGTALHPVRWEDGRLSLPAHPDIEGELVFAAMGGDKAACVDVAEAWRRHAGDLGVLALGPRGPADDVDVTWDDVEDFRSGSPSKYRRPSSGTMTARVVPGSQPMRPARRQAASPAPPPPGGARPFRTGGPPRLSPGLGPPVPAAWREELERTRAQRLDILLLFALGPAFQMLLSGVVAATWASGGARAAERRAHRPALEAALTGRLALAAAEWLGIDPDQVDARLHEGTGWGSLELSGTGGARYLRAALPAGWLAEVWACGLAVVDGHLVVAVQRAAWPDATVLAVPEPGCDPVLLTARAATDTGTPGDRAHWETSGTQAGPAGERGGPAGPPRGEADPS